MYAEFLGLVSSAHRRQQQGGTGRSSSIRPDLLITDLSLPGMDGFELIALIRKDPVLGRTPIICLSGYGGHAHERAGAAGCDRILQKPCMPDKLAKIAPELLLAVRERGSSRERDGLHRRGRYRYPRDAGAIPRDSKGIAVETAANGKLALERLGRRRAPASSCST